MELSLSVFYTVVIKISLEAVLGSETGIPKISFLMSPFLQATVIVHLHIIFNNEGHDSIPKTFFEKDQSSHTAVSISSCQDKSQNFFKKIC